MPRLMLKSTIKLSSALIANLPRLDRRLVWIDTSFLPFPKIDPPPDAGGPFGKFRNFYGEEAPADKLGFVSILRGFFRPTIGNLSDVFLFDYSKGFDYSQGPLVGAMTLWASWKKETIKPKLGDAELTACYIGEVSHELIGTALGPPVLPKLTWPHKCQCGSEALVLFRTIECSNAGCKHYTP